MADYLIKPWTCAALAFVLAGVTTSPGAHAAKIVTLQLEQFDDTNNLSIDVDTGLGNNLKNDAVIRCNYQLDGPIESGDLDRVKAAIKPFAERDIAKTPRLCLNSPGGSYREGMAISQYLMEENIGTAVPAGAICYSSCSFIFMGGTYPWKGELNRFLHVLGDLGFHAPYLANLPEEAYSGDTVAQAYAEGIKAMRTLMELGVASKVQRFPPELMQELMGKGPSDLFAVDTVGKAVRYRIHLYGAKLTLPLKPETFCNACVNILYGAYERYGKGGETDLCAPPVTAREESRPQGTRLVFDVAPRGGTCPIDVTRSGGGIASWTYIQDESDAFGDGLELAYWYLYPPNTPLKALSDGEPDSAVSGSGGGSTGPVAETEPSAPSEPAAGASQTPTDALIAFVSDAYLGHGKTNHEALPELFADRVDYFDKGVIDRDAVVAEHRRYYAKWPQRTFQIVHNSIKITPKEVGFADVAFTYTFTVANPKKTVRGLGSAQLTLNRDAGGRIRIVREAGGVLERK